jgi:hypothetical protein
MDPRLMGKAMPVGTYASPIVQLTPPDTMNARTHLSIVHPIITMEDRELSLEKTQVFVERSDEIRFNGMERKDPLLTEPFRIP